jgi:hypothetical protein
VGAVLAATCLAACSIGNARPLSLLPSCTVTGPAKFVDQSGGTDALCQAVAAAIAERSPGAHRVEVRLLSASLLAATVRLADGRTLPELRTGVSDGTITAGVVRQFAQDIANQISSTLNQH